MKSIAAVEEKFDSSLRTGLSDKVFKKLILTMLGNMTRGHLTIEDDGTVYTFGESAKKAHVIAHISVKHPSAYRQVILNGTIGSAEAYMQGAWETSDLVQVIRIFVLNMAVLRSLDTRWTYFFKFCANAWHKLNANSKKNAKKNISAHYDLSNDFFELFLDKTMLYSAAIFPNMASSLYEASVNKMEHICQRLNLNSADHLLEIGTGWGGMAIYAAKSRGCRVTTVTLSKEQCRYAQDWVCKEGLNDLVDVQLKDYRDVHGKFDKLLSIEMIEAVGYEYYKEYFAKCSSLLTSKGKMLIQAITISDQRFHQEKNNIDFIQRYIFPGGCLPSNEVIAKHVCKNTDMQIVGLEDITLHYAKTLSEWRRRFFSQVDQVKELGFDDVFIRMWEFYLAYCEGGFSERVIHTSQILMAKPDCRDLPQI